MYEIVLYFEKCWHRDCAQYKGGKPYILVVQSKHTTVMSLCNPIDLFYDQGKNDFYQKGKTW